MTEELAKFQTCGWSCTTIW